MLCLQFLGPQRYRPNPLDLDHPKLPELNFVVISHDHYDHLDSGTVARLNARFGANLTWCACSCPAASAAKKVCSGCCPVHNMQVRFSSGISFSSPQVVPGRRTQCLHAIAALGKSYIALCGVSCPACPLLQMASAIGRRHPSHCNVLKASCLLNAVNWSAGRRPALDAAAG